MIKLDVQGKIKNLLLHKAKYEITKDLKSKQNTYYEVAKVLDLNIKKINQISLSIFFENEENKQNENFSIDNFQHEYDYSIEEIDLINEKIQNGLSGGNFMSISKAESFFYQLCKIENKINLNSVNFSKIKSDDTIFKKANGIIKKLSSQIEEALNELSFLSGSNKDNLNSFSTDYASNISCKKQVDSCLACEKNKVTRSSITTFKENNTNSNIKINAMNKAPHVVDKLDKNGFIMKNQNSILKEIKFNFFYQPENLDIAQFPLINYANISIKEFRKGIIGRNSLYSTPFGEVVSFYADDTASARPHQIIEDYISSILPYYANTHSENSYFAVTTGAIFHQAEKFLLKYFNGGNDYVVVASGNGSTGATYTFIDLLSRSFPGVMVNNASEVLIRESNEDKSNIPVAIVSEYEHHSNILSWLYKGFQVYPIKNTAGYNWDDGLIDLKEKLEIFKDRPLIVISISAASNITTQLSPLKKISIIYNDFKLKYPKLKDKLIYAIDVAAYCSHRTLNLSDLTPDGIFISTHKLTGGPGSCGLLFFKKSIYAINQPPTKPSGGTVDLVTGYKTQDVIFSQDISSRETAGTPGVLQFIRAALTFQLQQLLGVEYIEQREHDLSVKVFDVISKLNSNWNFQGSNAKIHIIGPKDPHNRLSTFSCVFYDSKGEVISFKLIHRILSDFFGVQVRSGCNCAGPFGVKLLDIKEEEIDSAKKEILLGNYNKKSIYGWLRFNCHYSFTDEDVNYLLNSFSFIIENIEIFKKKVYVEKNMDYFLKKEYPDFMISDFRSDLHNFFYEFKLDITKPLTTKNISEEERNNFLLSNFQETRDKIKRLSDYVEEVVSNNDSDSDIIKENLYD